MSADGALFCDELQMFCKNEGSSVVVEREGKIEWLKPEDLDF